jgi:hypothetical protein
MKQFLSLVLVLTSLSAHSQTAQTAQTAETNHTPLVVGPVSLNCIHKPCSAATITGSARGSGVNGPATAQTGLTINFAKDNWWTGGKVGEVDGLNILVRQNAPHSDSSGILVNVQNQGHGFLSATEFSSTIVDPVRNVLTYGIDVQEGVLDHLNGDYIGAVYSADYGALEFDLNGFGTSQTNVRMINDANGQLTINTATGGNLQVNANGIFTTVSFHVNLATPPSSSAPCTSGQIGADGKYIYVCVATNTWKRSALTSF